MWHAPADMALMLAALLAASVSLDPPLPVGCARARIPQWLPFAVLTALGAASLVFGVLFPETIAAAFGGASIEVAL